MQVAEDRERCAAGAGDFNGTTRGRTGDDAVVGRHFEPLDLARGLAHASLDENDRWARGTRSPTTSLNRGLPRSGSPCQELRPPGARRLRPAAERAPS